MTNNRTSALKALSPGLLTLSDTVPGHASDPSGDALLQPVAPGARADGRLRFETTGAQTDRIVARLRTRIRVAGVAITVPVKVGRPVARRGAG